MAEGMTRSGVVVDHDVEMKADDGAILRSNVYRPAGDGAVPVLLMRTPYGKDGQQPAIHIIDPNEAVRAGFAVVVQDCRGRFGSEGEWRPYETEASDGAAAVEWAASLPFSIGRVGMYGSSYQGSAQLAAESASPPALRAIAPMCCWSDAGNGQTFRGGALELGKLARWTLMNMPERLRRRAATSEEIDSVAEEMEALASRGFGHLPLGTFAPIKRFDANNEFFDYLRSGPRHPLPALRKGSSNVKIPSLWIGGWFDSFLGEALRGFSECFEAGVPTQLVVGPWTHVNRSMTSGELNFGPEADTVGPGRAPLSEILFSWFSYWLATDDAPPGPPDPVVRTFHMGQNRWETHAEWPPPGDRVQRWYLGEREALSREVSETSGTVSYRYDPTDPAPTLGGATIMGADYPAGPTDQAALTARSDVLVFRSPVLEDPVDVRGPVSVELSVVTTAPSTDFVARLLDIFPDGREIGLTDGIRRLSGAPGGRTQVHRCIIDLWGTSYRFVSGHRIGLQITSSSFPRWDRNLNTAEPLESGTTMVPADQEVRIGGPDASCLIFGRP